MKSIGRVVLKSKNLPSHCAIWSAPYSSGAGRGRGAPFPSYRVIGKPPDEKPEDELPQSPLPAGRGDGAALPSQDRIAAPASGDGRGREETEDLNEASPQTPSSQQQVEETDELYSHPPQTPVKPVFMKRTSEPSKPWEPLGRGMPARQTLDGQRTPIGEENRHARPVRGVIPGVGRQALRRPLAPASAVQRLTGEDAAKQALDILKKRAEERGLTEGPTDMRGRGAMRGRGRGRGRGSGRGRGGRDDEMPDMEDEPEALLMGDDAVGERFVKRIGEDKWKEIEEIIEDVSSDILPPESDEDDYVEALHTNLSLEFEPEYYMEDFGTNPDIDEKSPISLRDYLLQMKPLIVGAEGIESEEEWEEFLEDTMRRAPYLRELLHCYAGYGRLSAREEQAHLKRLAKYIPDNAHQSVKNFTERALVSLQSNPGWGFEKKYLFTRKLVEDIAQHYKGKQKR